MVEIIPAVLSPDAQELTRVAQALRGFAKSIQLDVGDGVFVGQKTWPYDDGKRYPENGELTKLAAGLRAEVDLMIKDPEHAIDGWVAAGAARLIIHAESTGRLRETIHSAKEKGVEVGAALSLATPLSILEPVIGELDFVQCMGIRTIGWQGEPFEMDVLSHIRELRRAFPGLTISVDGGVSQEHVRELAAAGANRLVVGSALVKAPDMQKTFEKLFILANG